MKKNSISGLLFCISLFCISCNNNSKDENVNALILNKPPQKINDSFIVNNKVNTVDTSATLMYVWSVDFEKKIKIKNPVLKSEYINVDSLIKGLNVLYAQVLLEKVSLHNDTLFAKINDSEYLGERMGSYGAAEWLASTIINLTSVPGIKYVKIDFEEGSHASPGIWSKYDYDDVVEQK